MGDFGERAFGVRQRLGLATTELDVASRVRVAFDDLLRAREVLGYERQNLGLTQGFLDKARLRFEAGDVAELEVLRAEVEAGRAASRVAAATHALDIARGRLNVLLAREADT